MRVIVESKDSIKITSLPLEVSGNFWVADNNSKNLLNAEADGDSWILKSNNEVKMVKDFSQINYIDMLKLQEEMYICVVNIVTKEKYILYVAPSYETYENLVVDYNKTNEIIIGRTDNCDISIQNPLFAEKHLQIKYDQNTKAVTINSLSNSKMFVNGVPCKQKQLASGDEIFTSSFFMYYFGSLILIKNSNNTLRYNIGKFQPRVATKNPNVGEYSKYVDTEMKVYDKNTYYQRPPRFRRKFDSATYSIDPPPPKINKEETPLLFTLAPMLTMGMMSIMTGGTSLQNIASGRSTLKSEIVPLITCGIMILSTVFFPMIQNSYTKVRDKQREKMRIKKYQDYLNSLKAEIEKTINYQKNIIIENNLPINQVNDIIINKNRSLWEREMAHEDFLELRLGIGNRTPDVEIKAQEEHFTLEYDDLNDIVKTIVNDAKEIADIPITLNLRTHNKVGLIGAKSVTNNYLDGLMLQVLAYHGYDLLRIVILTNENNRSYWEKYKNLPYLWSNDKSIRYYAATKDEVNKVTTILMEEYNYRKEMSANNSEIPAFTPYYLILTDDVLFVKNNAFIDAILSEDVNLGYTVLMAVEKLNALPNGCSMFVNVEPANAGLFSNQVDENNQLSFKPDFVNFSIYPAIMKISNIPLDINSGKYVLPTKYGFLEMFDVGNVNQLNIINRWANNDIINSLETPVGIDEQGELFNLDLHEKVHGPHGLVAGMTGSGKSEFIITYILSMAVNYSPEEVQFVLIDYKGGGLALTFDNRENNVKLPHVVGTLTNLDVVEMKRCLASINSELKRRQNLFKTSREKLNESSMDIYKYQELYRAGKLDEPMSHLFIISDEFAELKSQQPEFMEELISTARIGRSLGVHLILATQKPSGVVDDQIWSNSKFRVCLKVQDKSDSNDMLKRPDAAMLKETGRFYLQVGYNEFFAKGQSAYAGVPYYESDKKINVIDSNVDFVNDIGTIIKRGNIEKDNAKYVVKGEELPNVLNYIIETAKNKNLKIMPLWLERIPAVIYVDKLKQKYQYSETPYKLCPIVGEYDQPSKQQQLLMTVPISEDGNVVLYGTTGSGKELFITSMVYSLMTSHRPEEVNVYIMDFGAGVLNSFSASPHVGDIVHSGDDEKIENTFKYIVREMDDRKKKFLSYNGNYADFIEQSEEKLPNILLIINSYDVFSDAYENYEDRLYEIARECNKYGIYLMLTVSSVNSVKSKMLQTFKTIYTLQLNNELDYRNIFGNNNGVVPSKIYGRGLLKKDMVLEFQTAYAYEKDKLYKNIAEACESLSTQYTIKATPIPVLPKTVELASAMNGKAIDFDTIPIGIVKETLAPARISLKDKMSYFISFRDFNDNLQFVRNLVSILDTSDLTTYVFDTKYIYEDQTPKKVKYLNNNFSALVKSISEYVEKVKDMLEKNNNNIKSIKECQDILVVIIGFEKFMDKLSEEDKNEFISIIENSKEALKVHLLLIDIPVGFKQYEYETWFKNATNSTSGLWIGDGFGEQALIKPTKVIQSYYDSINSNFGYIVEYGQVKFVKIIEKI